jgi:hypothetical protein
MIELNLGIFCVCLPTFRPLIGRWIPQLGPNFYTPPCPNIYVTWQSVHDNRDRHEQLGDGTSPVDGSKASGGTGSTQNSSGQEEDIGLEERMFEHPPPQAYTRGERGYIEPL